MKSKTETFESLLNSFQYRYDLYQVFDDFLTMSLCSVTRNPVTGLSHYEDLYLQAMERYKDDTLRFKFPKMFACLVNEMEAKLESGNDVVGSYYEKHLYKKGTAQYFTPWHICEFMARSTLEACTEENEDRPKRILDPACGSGRMLLASAKVYGKEHFYYGIDIDQTCVKMTALNLFLNGMFNSEVMCANALLPDEFWFSYKISFLPLGVFRIEEKEQSPLWQAIKRNMPQMHPSPVQSNLLLPSEEGNQAEYLQQLKLF